MNATIETSVISCSPEVMSGAPVFVGTRVPVQSLLDYLAGGHSLGEFLDDFPTVSREQAIGLLDVANKLLTSKNVAQLYAIVA